MNDVSVTSTTGDPRRDGPLAGVRVLDLSRVLAGPHCGRNLAHLGAEVIKIESPEGDLTRYSHPRVNSIATYFTQQNCGKDSLSLDLSHPDGASIFRRLAAVSDVVLENFRPEVMDRLGVGYRSLAAENPRLVYCAITGYGLTGPWKNRRAYATVIGAESGFLWAENREAGHVTAPAEMSHGDTYCALYASNAIVAALYQRERSGRGQLIDVSMTESLLSANEHAHAHLLDDLDHDNLVISFEPSAYPVFTTGEGRQVAISGHPAERGTFERYCRGVNRPELIDDGRFATIPLRKRALVELIAELQLGAARFATAQDLEASFARESLAMGIIRTVREVADSDWSAARNAVVEVSDRAGGTVRIPNSPWHFSDASTGVYGEPKYRGEDNRTVLQRILHLDDTEIDRLETATVLSSRVPHGNPPVA